MTTPPRPTSHSDEVATAHMALIRPKVKKYLEDTDGPIKEDELDEHMRSVRQAMRYETDGYKIARDLDSDGWEVDEALVELMGRLAHDNYEALQKVTEAWVTANNITTTLVVGTQVNVKNYPMRGKSVAGEITQIDTKLAKFTVCCPSLGHVKERVKGAGSTTYGVIVGYEDVTPLEPVLVEDQAAPVP